MKKVLAIARPNLRYEHYNNYRKALIKAVLRENKVFFYETHSDDLDWIVRLDESRVKSLFEASAIIAHQPFLKKENKDFITVLYRSRTRYKKAFEKMKKAELPIRRNRPTIIRNK